MQDLENSECLQRNIDLLKRVAPWCIEPILQAPVGEWDYCETAAGEVNASRCTAGKTHYLHSQEGALTEAEQWFRDLALSNSTETLYLFGTGLGYAFSAARQWLDQDKRRHLVFLEDDLSLLRRFLSINQAKEVFSHPRVLLIPFRTPEAGDDFDTVIPLFASTNYRFAPLKHYAEQRHKLCERLKVCLGIKSADWVSEQGFYGENYQTRYYQNFYANIHRLPEARSPHHLQEAFRDVPAIICGAGPSLMADMNALSQLGDRALIFGAGTGVNVLARHGVMPHFGAAMDPNPTSASRMVTSTAYELPYFYQNMFFSKAFELIHGPKLNCRGEDFFGVETWLYEELGLTDFLPVPTRVSTTYACLGLAASMGCSPLTLVGVDLSASEKRRYPEGVRAHPLDAPHERSAIAILPESKMLSFETDRGEIVLTTGNWLREATAYAKFAEMYPQVTIINATREGIEIPGVPAKSLEEAVQGPPRDLLNWVHTEIQGCSPVPISDEDLHATLETWEESLESAVEVLQKVVNELLRARATRTQSEGLAKLWQQLKQQTAYKHYLKTMEEHWEERTCRDRYLLDYRPEIFSEVERVQQRQKLELEKAVFLLRLTHCHLGMMEFGWEKCALKEAALVEVPSIPPEVPAEVNVEIQGEPHRLHYADGALKGEWHTLDGKLHGPSIFYAESGAVLARGLFLQGSREGKNFQYYVSGQPYSVQQFLAGKLHGEQRYYFESGASKAILNYNQGRLEGAVTLYHPNQRLMRELHFHEGELEGTERMWGEAGDCLIEAEYKGGLPVKAARMWDLKGTLRKEVIFYDAPDHCDIYQWDEEGSLTEETLYTPEKPDDLMTMRRSLANFNRNIDSSIDKLTGLDGAPEEVSSYGELETALNELKTQLKQLRSRFE